MMRMTMMLAASIGLCLTAAPAAADSANLHTFHCLHGCPVGAPANDDLIVREIYTLASNPITKLADWVAYRVTPDTVGPSQQRNWQKDDDLAGDETLKPDDYDGASAALRVDRGHQAPLAAFSGTPFWSETNFLSNITLSIGVQKGPPIGVQKGPPSSSGVAGRAQGSLGRRV